MRPLTPTIAAAFLALLTLVPASAVADKPLETDVTIDIRMDAWSSLGYWSPWEGHFGASGAISGSGTATASFNSFVSDETIDLTINGGKGSMRVVVREIVAVGTSQGKKGLNVTEYEGTFEVLAGVGAYQGLSLTGTARGTAYRKGDPWDTEASAHQEWRLEGALDGN